jgi:hypothetical protein
VDLDIDTNALSRTGNDAVRNIGSMFARAV